MPNEAIKVRIEARERAPRSEDPRSQFWAPLRNSEKFSNKQISALEGKLCRELGPTLQEALIESIAQPLRKDLEFYRADLDFERFFMHFPRSERDFQLGEAYSKYLDFRLELIRGNPSIREAQARIGDAVGLTFAARIQGYSSLDMGLAVGSIEKAAKVFNDNFDSFRVFLDAFIPVAFGQVFTDEFADQLKFDVTIPNSLQNAFETASEKRNTSDAKTAQTTVKQSALTPENETRSSNREKAEWLWKLANGSLVVPLILALAVMYFGIKLIADVSATQHAALQPILQYQLEVLREDRLRFEEDRQRFSALFQSQMNKTENKSRQSQQTSQQQK